MIRCVEPASSSDSLGSGLKNKPVAVPVPVPVPFPFSFSNATNSYSPSFQHEMNIERWQETTAWFMDGPGRLIKRPKSEKFVWDGDFKITGETSDLVDLSVISEDTFTSAIRLKKENNLNPLVLNMANAYNPGGGVYKGSIAQEEDLFRRSNYFQLTSLPEFYPLKELEVIYSPSVAVYKNPNYKLLSEVSCLSCIACAAERDPKTIPNTDDPENPYNRLYADPHVAEITKKRIETLFQIAIIKKHDSLVLGGLGCGAFNNPQMRIIEYFNDNLRKYSGLFRKIVFAVLSKRDPNFELFSRFIGHYSPRSSDPIVTNNVLQDIDGEVLKEEGEDLC